jgi:hypothetical protein
MDNSIGLGEYRVQRLDQNPIQEWPKEFTLGGLLRHMTHEKIFPRNICCSYLLIKQLSQPERHWSNINNMNLTKSVRELAANIDSAIAPANFDSNDDVSEMYCWLSVFSWRPCHVVMLIPGFSIVDMVVHFCHVLRSTSYIVPQLHLPSSE